MRIGIASVYGDFTDGEAGLVQGAFEAGHIAYEMESPVTGLRDSENLYGQKLLHGDQQKLESPARIHCFDRQYAVLL